MKKIIGWILVIVGVVIIFGSFYYSFLVFVKGSPAPQIFETPLLENSPSARSASNNSFARGTEFQQEMQQKMQETIINEIQKRMPSNFLPKIFNLTSLAIFVGIAMLAGGKISLIGIKLLK
ncbi:hypothetical protein J7J81_03505 [bacterium]|nr:hypothetical protein [bacterium]